MGNVAILQFINVHDDLLMVVISAHVGVLVKLQPSVENSMGRLAKTAALGVVWDYFTYSLFYFDYITNVPVLLTIVITFI